MAKYEDENFINIVLPTEAADGYYMNKNKQYIDDFIFIEQEWYDKLFDSNVFYILGSKGSGKTLYAAYMCAEIRKNTKSKAYTIDVGDYGKLIAMKTSNHLDFTAYLTMWKVVLIQKFLLGIDSAEISLLGRTKNFKEIQHVISEYFGYDVSEDSFNPVSMIDSYGKQREVTNYLAQQFSIINNANVLGVNSEHKIEYKKADNVDVKKQKDSLIYVDTWMRSINEFHRAIENISFKYNHYLFVDGLDVRPREIDAKEYSECIGALVRAVYDINTKVLGNMRRKDKNDFKIIALTRTDIFLNSELVNVTSCINDNCVELDWTYSNEKDFKYSNLYKMMNRILGWDGISKEKPVEKYFSFRLPYPVNRPLSASMYIQRQSRLRPRDIVVMLRLIQQECKKRHLVNPNVEVMDSTELITKYSNYYTDQIKSEMMFNYTGNEIRQMFDLIKMIKRDLFDEDDFKAIFNNFCKSQGSFKNLFPDYQQVLDVWYSLDLIGWQEGLGKGTRVHWHYREVKAIDEVYRLPWEYIHETDAVKFIIHKGASRNVLGFAKK